MDQCGLSNTSRAYHKYYRSRPSCMYPFSWSTNSLKNGIKRLKKTGMLNETMLLKVFLPCTWRLLKQCSIKELRLLVWRQKTLFLTHERILLKTRSFSCFFSCPVCAPAG